MTTLLAVEDVAVSFGGVRALSGVSLKVQRGEIFAIIGPNGAGKPTLFNAISGLCRLERGHVTLDGRDVTGSPAHRLAQLGLSRTFQNLQIFFRMTAAENVMVGRHLHEDRDVLAHMLALPSVWRQNRQTRIVAHELLALVGLGAWADKPAGSLPYGALKRLEIARAMAAEPRLLLLDEPAAGCNPVETEDVDDVLQTISRHGVTIVLVEHDMRLVMKISDRIHVLDHGTTLADGDAAAVRSNPAVIAAYLGASEKHTGVVS
ncbi:MAG TPA: ABC transporter ATP-binding protein [Xanthobacteraceae bacterium]